MVTEKDYPLNWVILPGSSLTAELEVGGWPKPTIVIAGNRQGLFSLGSLLLWISDSAADNESLSITGLPFVQAKSTLCLIVVQPMTGSDEYGQLVRTDQDKQFQWLINPDLLEREAINLMGVAFTPDHYLPDHYHANLSPASEYDLFFGRIEDHGWQRQAELADG